MREQKKETIEIKLDTIRHLYDSMDPAPRYEKDLNPRVEEYIMSDAEELPRKSDWHLYLYLPENEIRGIDETAVKKSILLNFDRKAELLEKKAAKKTRMVIQSAVFGILFLGLCLSASYWLATYVSSGADFYEILSQGLVVIGWVALWNPVEYLLFDRWEPRKEIIICQKLAGTPVEIIPYKSEK